MTKSLKILCIFVKDNSFITIQNKKWKRLNCMY